MRISNVLWLFGRFASAGVVILLPIILILFVVYFFIYKKLLKGKRQLKLGKVFIWSVFICYLFIVIGATLLSRSGGVGFSTVPNLHLFSTYRLAWHQSNMGEWRNIVLNIIMFVPIGMGLPLLSKKGIKLWKVVGLGFFMSAFIEITQLLTARGGFALDDIFNNTLGALLGFCLYRLFYILSKEKSARLVKVLKWSSPWLVVVSIFLGLFTVYQFQEFGNLRLTPVTRQNMSQAVIKSEVEFNTNLDQASIFSTSERVTIEETKLFAAKFFETIGSILDENQTMVFDGTVVYRGRSIDSGKEQSLWVDRQGMTFWFNDFTYFESIPHEGLDEEVIREKLGSFGIHIPQSALFYELGDGNYQFNVIVVDDVTHTYHGWVGINIREDYNIENISYRLVSAYPVKSVDLISEQMAFERIEQGSFLFHHGSKIRDLRIFSIELDWIMDSKGFLRPTYLFYVEIDGIETAIMIPAEK